MTILLLGNKRYLEIAFGKKGTVAFSREQGTNDFRAWKEYSFYIFLLFLWSLPLSCDLVANVPRSGEEIFDINRGKHS